MKHTHTHTHTRTHAHTHIHTYTHIHTHAHTRTHAHTHTRTHTECFTQRSWKRVSLSLWPFCFLLGFIPAFILAFTFWWLRYSYQCFSSNEPCSFGPRLPPPPSFKRTPIRTCTKMYTLILPMKLPNAFLYAKLKSFRGVHIQLLAEIGGGRPSFSLPHSYVNAQQALECVDYLDANEPFDFRDGDVSGSGSDISYDRDLE